MVVKLSLCLLKHKGFQLISALVLPLFTSVVPCTNVEIFMGFLVQQANSCGNNRVDISTAMADSIRLQNAHFSYLGKRVEERHDSVVVRRNRKTYIRTRYLRDSRSNKHNSGY